MTEIKGRVAGWLVRALAILALCAPLAAAAQAITAIWSTNEFGNATLRKYPESTPTLTANRRSVQLTMRSTTNASVSSTVSFGAPPNQAIQPGVYDDIGYFYNNRAIANFSSEIPYSSCYPSAPSRVTVMEAVYDGEQLVSFAADFELICSSYGTGTTFVELRINSTVPLTIDRPANWTTPHPMAFPPRTFVEPGASALSKSTTIWGINAAAPISISGGQYSINGGPFTSAAGTVNARDRVRLLMTAPAINASATAHLTVGTVTVPFTVSAVTTGVPVSALRVSGSTDDAMLGGATVLVASPDLELTRSQAGSNRVTFQFTGPPTAGTVESYSVGLSLPSVQVLAVGAYEEAQQFGNNTAAGLTFSTGSRSCVNAFGRFVILEIAYDAAGNLQRLAANFEHRCVNSPSVQYGEVRFASAVPFTFQKSAGSTLPDAFAFEPEVGALPGAWVPSNEISVLGTNAASSISITGGEYSVNGGTFTSITGTVQPRDRVQVRVQASATPGATATARLSIGGRSADLVVRTYAPGDTITAFSITGGVEISGAAPDYNFYVNTGSNGQYFYVDAGPRLGGSESWSIGISLTQGSALSTGAYEAGSGSISFSGYKGGASYYCGQQTTGRFVVLDIAYSSSGIIERLGADFTVWCNGVAYHGELRWKSTATMIRYKPTGSTLPDAFSFATVYPVAGGERVVSNRVSILGVNTAVPITISGGEYSLNGGPFTAASGSASYGDSLVVRVVSPRPAGATQTATVNVGGRMASFSARTYQSGDLLDALSYAGDASDYISGGTRGTVFAGGSNTITVQRYSGQNSISATVRGPTGTYFNLYFGVPGNLMAVGTYPDAQRFGFGLSGPSMSVFTDNRGCNTISGSFTVRDVAFDLFGNVTRFAVDFEQHCEGAAAALRGELRFHSAVPLAALNPSFPKARFTGFDANGDLRADIVFQHTDGRAGLWTMDGPTQTGGASLLVAGSGWSMAHHGDFNGDGKSDILWKHTDGRVAMWLMDGGTQIGGALLMQAGAGWLPKQVADFDGDGRADILWTHPDGRVAMWLMNGSVQAGGALLLVAGNAWVPKLVGDLNGDGRADILFEHSDGSSAAWLMNGTTQIGGARLLTAGANWYAKLLADVNGDGKADIVWWNTDGKSAVWLMNGVTQVGGAVLMNSGSPYVPVLTADIDGDGKGDIVWRATDGTTIFWLMNGTAQAGGGQILGAGSGWTVVRVADFSGDGIGDALLAHTDGRVRMDLFDGLNYSSSATLLNGGSGWSVVTTP